MRKIIFAQTQATTTDGKKVTLNEDGTWKYVEEVKQVTSSENNSDCSAYIATEVDKVTGKTSVIYILKESNSIIFSIQAVGAGRCIDDNKMNVLFRDGTRLELINDGKFNCDANYTQYFGGAFGKKKELEMFRTKEIETMRIWTSKSYVEENFTSEQSKELMNVVDCLSKN